MSRSTPEYAVHVAAEAGVGTLALFHHDPLHTDDDIDCLVAEAAALPEAGVLNGVFGAAEGMVVEVDAGSVHCTVTP
jgi:ribonuclease BN (tRNA processing enzyme)